MRTLAPKASSTPFPSGTDSSEVLSKKTVRSRNGCQACKARHIRCDQQSPSCGNCLKKRLSCPGYAKELRWSTKYEAPDAETWEPPLKRRRLAEDASSRSAGVQFTANPDSQSEGARPGFAAPNPTEKTVLPASSLPMPAEGVAYLLSSPHPQDVTEDGAGPSFGDAGEFSAEPPDGCCLPPRDCDRAASPVKTTIMLDTVHREQDIELLPDHDVQKTATVDSRPRNNQMMIPRSGNEPANLLRWFYRSQPSHYSDTDLVEHYFSNVCRLYALFDSVKNPFRALVGSNWDSSGSISLSIQSMACAHLANNDSAMVRIGRQKQRQARMSILNDLLLWKNGKISADRVLLAILLLGPTVSWHDTGDLGLEYLNIARELISSKLYQTPQSKSSDQLDRFFSNSMIYWEMMVSFVDSEQHVPPPDPAHVDLDLVSTAGNGGDAGPSTSLVKPHPWTGVAPHVTTLFAEVGRIVRRRVSSGTFATPEEEAWASAIELSLSRAELPALESVADYGDQNTPQDHFIQLAEAYRCTGLLQIYHIFPAVLSRRMSDLNFGVADGVVDFDALGWYRTTLARYILNIIESLPLWSGTSCLHPILVLAAGSELKIPNPLDQEHSTADVADPSIAMARSFAEQRLSDLAKRLPQKPFLRMLDIMKETWLQLDMFGIDVHWMQVMYEKGWETIMG